MGGTLYPKRESKIRTKTATPIINGKSVFFLPGKDSPPFYLKYEVVFMANSQPQPGDYSTLKGPDGEPLEKATPTLPGISPEGYMYWFDGIDEYEKTLADKLTQAWRLITNNPEAAKAALGSSLEDFGGVVGNTAVSIAEGAGIIAKGFLGGLFGGNDNSLLWIVGGVLVLILILK